MGWDLPADRRTYRQTDRFVANQATYLLTLVSQESSQLIRLQRSSHCVCCSCTHTHTHRRESTTPHPAQEGQYPLPPPPPQRRESTTPPPLPQEGKYPPTPHRRENTIPHPPQVGSHSQGNHPGCTKVAPRLDQLAAGAKHQPACNMGQTGATHSGEADSCPACKNRLDYTFSRSNLICFQTENELVQSVAAWLGTPHNGLVTAK